DSPVGYRLPLSSLKHLNATSYPHVVPIDPFVPRGQLPDPQEMLAKAPEPKPDHTQPKASFTADPTAQQERTEQEISEIDGEVRTAVTVEVRDGHLCVFLPPVPALEDYLELIAAAEAAAKSVGLPVHIEGYAPPHDPRLNV